MKSTIGNVFVLVFGLLTIGSSSPLFGQQHPPVHCPSDRLNDSLITHDPRWARSYFYMEQAIHAHQNTPVEERSNEIYTLPVVVHVIHTGEPVGTGSNISDAQVHSAITALNEDFRRMSGTNGFGNGVDIGVDFCLAVRDPNGDPTNGIVRVNGSSVTNYATQGITAGQGQGAEELAVKALSTWPRTSYVNIWVVNEIENNNGGSGIQGYAYFPFNNPRDGIVVLFNAFGTTGTLKSYTNLNRTLTHEVGHYLGLYHTFHDTNSCSSETNCSTQGDRVCDTPSTILSSSCSNPACGGTQQVQNYLDYTNQTCQNMFSDGQRTRMRATLETQRTSMTVSLGCQSVNNLDAGISAVVSPTGASCSTSHSPIVTLTNYGVSALTSTTIQYNLNGVGLHTFNWTGNLGSGASANVTLPEITAGMGQHTIYAWTVNPNGSVDDNTANDMSSNDFEVAVGGTITLVVTLDFFGVENTWRITNSSGVQVAGGGPYPSNQQGAQFTHNLCLPLGCYTLTFFDSFGDGQGFVNGGFQLFDAANNILVSQSGNWGSQSNNPFCVVAAPPAGITPVAGFTISDAVICQGQQISFTNTSTNSPTTYAWTFSGGSPATSSATNPTGVSWAATGTYSVSLTATNAQGSHSYTCTNCITVIGGPSVTLGVTPPTCNGSTNGQVNATVSGGYSPYTYSWNTGASGSSISNLGAGSYNVTVTNSEGCTSTASATLTAPTSIVITGTPTQVTCNGLSNGAITVSATGGTGSKTFTWSNGATGATVSGLAAGTYTVTAADQNGCSVQQSYTITAPSVITITGTPTHVACNGLSTGSITVSATGGTGSKTFTWSNGATGTTVSGLTVGSYTVTATDQNGCSVQQSYTITSSSTITITGTPVHVTCNGLSNGSITVSATGGTGNKTFTWSNGATGTTASSLAAGTYTVTATDQNGCSVQQSYTITSPSAISITGTPTHVTCNGLSNGSITVSATGGTGNKTFTWSNGATGATASGLAAGTYTVTATDQNGCSVQQSFTLTTSSGITITGVLTHVTCNGLNNGLIVASATGGTGNKTFTWSNGATGATVSGLAAGSYTVTATDQNGCSAQQSFTITTPSAINITGTVTPISCGGLNNGSIQVSATGGVGSKTFSWSHGPSGATVNNLAAGTYTVTATDQTACSVQQSFTITAPGTITLSGTIQHASCGSSNGSIAVSTIGGAGQITISWSNGASGTSVSNLAPGSYTATATDASGCSSQQIFIVNSQSALQVSAVATNVTCAGGTNGSVTASVSGASGALVYNWSNGSTGSTLSGLSAGTYSVTAVDAGGCSATASVQVTAPSPISINLSAQGISCGSGTGSASVQVSGGTGTYSITWSNGATGTSVSGLSPGGYSVSVADAAGCAASSSFNITVTAALQVNLTHTPVSCAGSNDAVVQVSTIGGNGSYTYLWNTGGSTSSLTGMGAGAYSVLITDGNGCTGEASISIQDPEPLSAAIFKSDVTCNGMGDGTAVVSVTGGTGPVELTWSNGDEGVSVDGLSAGIYTVIVSDANGCTLSESIAITEPQIIAVTTEVLQEESCSGNDGIATVNAMGGTGVLSYDWSNGTVGQQADNLTSGPHTVLVSDTNGCSVVVLVDVAYACEINLPTTRLTTQYCDATGLALTAIIECDVVTNAEQYQWRFGNLAGQGIAEMVTPGPAIALNTVNGILGGFGYVVQVRARLEGTWANYGEVCMIGTTDLPFATQLIEEHCGATIMTWGQTILADPLPNVINYEWNIYGPEYEWTSFTANNQFTLHPSMLFVEGVTYQVRVRCGLGGGIYTDWGLICPITFNPEMTVGMDEQENGTAQFLFYPNPNNGQSITIQTSGMSGDETIQVIRVLNTAGQLCATLPVNLTGIGTQVVTYSFDNRLSQGIYILDFQYNGTRICEKLIVQ